MAQNFPMVRRTIFNFKDRQYILEMNQDLPFHYVKKMAATAVRKELKDLQFFHNNADMTTTVKETLETLFGQSDPIIFEIKENERHETFDRILKIRLNQEYCQDHPGKYRYFYCRTCEGGRHLCSECILSGDHNGHEIIEKQDYLQSSKEIIEKFFTDMDLHYPKLTEQSKEMRTAIIKSFGGLIDYLKGLQDCLLKFLDTIEGNNSDVNGVIESNYQNLKAACTEGLDILKTRVSIEDMMLNDEIFLIVDQRIQKIKEIRQRFLAYINSKRDAYLGIESLRTIINLTADIYAFLDGFKAKCKIDDMNAPFENVEKKKVIGEILEGIPEQDVQKLRSNYKPHFDGYNYVKVPEIIPDKLPDIDIKVEMPKKLNPYDIFKGQIIGNMKDKEIKTKVRASKEQFVKEYDFSGKKAYRFHIGSKEVDIPLIERIERPSTPKKDEEQEEEDIMHHIEHCPSCNKKLRDSNKKEMVIENPYKYYIENGFDHYICMPMVGTNCIKIFDVFSKQITLREITNFIFKEEFLDGCSWYNYKDNLYVLGGISNGKISKDFFRYNAENNKLERLTSIPEPRYGHSICAGDDNCLYVVGGNSKAIFKFDLMKGSWQKLPIFLNEIRYHPNVWIYNNMIYAAFGEDEKTILPTIEKGKLNGKGTLENLGRSEKYKRTYAGIVLTNKDSALLIGGLNAKQESLATVIEIDMKTGKVSLTGKKLDEINHFQQNYLMLVDQDVYGNFSLDGSNNFVLFTYKV